VVRKKKRKPRDLSFDAKKKKFNRAGDERLMGP